MHPIWTNALSTAASLHDANDTCRRIRSGYWDATEHASGAPFGLNRSLTHFRRQAIHGSFRSRTARRTNSVTRNKRTGSAGILGLGFARVVSPRPGLAGQSTWRPCDDFESIGVLRAGPAPAVAAPWRGNQTPALPQACIHGRSILPPRIRGGSRIGNPSSANP